MRCDKFEACQCSCFMLCKNVHTHTHTHKQTAASNKLPRNIWKLMMHRYTILNSIYTHTRSDVRCAWWWLDDGVPVMRSQCQTTWGEPHNIVSTAQTHTHRRTRALCAKHLTRFTRQDHVCMHSSLAWSCGWGCWLCEFCVSVRVCATSRFLCGHTSSQHATYNVLHKRNILLPITHTRTHLMPYNIYLCTFLWMCV